MKRGNNRKFGRVKNQREALIFSLATALIEHGRIKTTRARAKTLSSFIERLITRAITKDLTARRLLVQELGAKSVKKLVDEITPKFGSRSSGFTRIVALPQRHSDGAPISVIEFVS